MPRTTRAVRVAPSRSLPANVADLEAQRVVQQRPRLIDEVEKVLLALFENPEFRALRGQDDPEQYVQGSVWADDTCSAIMVQDKARELGLQLVVSANLTEIVNKLRGAERRFVATRKQRKAAAA